MKKFTIFLLVAALVLGVSGMAGATVVTLEDTSQTTTFTATVAEQADVTVPATVTFTVNDVTSSTNGTGFVSATSIVLDDGHFLKISLKGNAAAFTPPGGVTTWDASDVSWAAGTWTNGTGNAASLSDTANTYVLVATSNANAASTSSTITFTLAAKAAASPAIWAGDHTLTATWKFESLAP